ncbi:GLUG motif-containing protein [Chitinophaga agrisoli]|nr:GLUG motif-containing protein [Chitinophaga agrisoli]
MKRIYFLLLFVILAAPACKKDNTTPQDDPDENPGPDPVKPTLNFKYARLDMALIRAFANNEEITMATFVDAPAGTGYTCEVTGSNGMKPGNVENVRITGTTGASEFAFRGLQRYKDGKLTFKVTFNDGKNTVAEGSIDKEEFVVRGYKDLMLIDQLRTIMKYDRSIVYTQPVDIAFPDTVFAKAPVSSLRGAYDGQGHKITNFTLTAANNGFNEFVGLFGVVDSSTVKNLRLELSAAGITSPNMSSDLGGIAGYAVASSVINCSVKGAIQSAGEYSITGGITGFTSYSRIIGCSFNGILKGGNAGGITGNLFFSYVNMSYAVTKFTGNVAGGIVGMVSEGINGSQDTLLNTYAYILEPETVQYLFSLFPDPSNYSRGYVINNCFSNAKAPQTGATLYSTTTELNGLLANLTVSNLPEGIAAPPADKPFKAGADPAKPAVLWWE